MNKHRAQKQNHSMNYYKNCTQDKENMLNELNYVSEKSQSYYKKSKKNSTENLANIASRIGLEDSAISGKKFAQNLLNKINTPQKHIVKQPQQLTQPKPHALQQQDVEYAPEEKPGRTPKTAGKNSVQKVKDSLILYNKKGKGQKQQASEQPAMQHASAHAPGKGKEGFTLVESVISKINKLRNYDKQIINIKDMQKLMFDLSSDNSFQQGPNAYQSQQPAATTSKKYEQKIERIISKL